MSHQTLVHQALRVSLLEEWDLLLGPASTGRKHKVGLVLKHPTAPNILKVHPAPWLLASAACKPQASMAFHACAGGSFSNFVRRVSRSNTDGNHDEGRSLLSAGDSGSREDSGFGQDEASAESALPDTRGRLQQEALQGGSAPPVDMKGGASSTASSSMGPPALSRTSFVKNPGLSNIQTPFSSCDALIDHPWPPLAPQQLESIAGLAVRPPHIQSECKVSDSSMTQHSYVAILWSLSPLVGSAIARYCIAVHRNILLAQALCNAASAVAGLLQITKILITLAALSRHKKLSWHTYPGKRLPDTRCAGK